MTKFSWVVLILLLARVGLTQEVPPKFKALAVTSARKIISK